MPVYVKYLCIKIGRSPTACRLLLHKLQAARVDFGQADSRPRAARPSAVRSAIGIQAETGHSDVSACSANSHTVPLPT